MAKRVITQQGGELPASVGTYQYGPTTETQAVAWGEVPIGGPPALGRDGLMLCFLPSTNKYWLFGGWNTSLWTNQTTNELWSSSDAINWTLIQTHLENPPV